MSLEQAVWKRGDGSIIDPTNISLEEQMTKEIHWYDFVQQKYGLIIENDGKYLLVQRNGDYISLRKPW